jgi:hypothetical protein
MVSRDRVVRFAILTGIVLLAAAAWCPTRRM